MIFKNIDERIDYACGYFAMISGFDFETIKKFYFEKSDDEKKDFLDTFAFSGSVCDKIKK